jgi:signal transduction histidine kinase
MDALLALLVAGLGVVTELRPPEPPDHYRAADAFSVTLMVVAAAPLVVRRRYPVPVFGLSFAVVAVHGAQEYAGAGAWIAMLLSVYAVAAYSQRRWAVACLVIALVGSTIGIVAAWDQLDVADVVASIAIPITAWILGDSLRVRRAYVQAVEDRAEQLERGREADARRAVVEERSRIARELHDIVAHSMSVMVVQAGAARRTLGRDVERASEAIGQIEATGRGALEEMRRLVGVLRRDGDANDRRGDELLPQPGFTQIPGLVERCRDAGLDVTYKVEGLPRTVSEGAQLVVYRMVQEALTNVMKHAGPQVRARVTLTYGNRRLVLVVQDNGRGAAALANGSPKSPGERHGLAGMWERVSLYNGEMRWGPKYGGGFRVSVRLPLDVGPDDSGIEGDEPVGPGAAAAATDAGVTGAGAPTVERL